MPYRSIDVNIDTVGWVPLDQRYDFPGQEELGFRINGCGDTGVIEVFYSEIKQPQQAWNNARLNKLRDRLQDLCDHRVSRSDPEFMDDPAVASNPNRESFFWEGADLVSRPLIIVSVYLENGLPHLKTRRPAD